MIREIVIDGTAIACWVNDGGFVEGRKGIVFVHGSGGDHTALGEPVQGAAGRVQCGVGQSSGPRPLRRRGRARGDALRGVGEKDDRRPGPEGARAGGAFPGGGDQHELCHPRGLAAVGHRSRRRRREDARQSHDPREDPHRSALRDLDRREVCHRQGKPRCWSGLTCRRGSRK